MIEEFIYDICEILNIEPPEVSYDTSCFLSETMLAFYDGEKIYIRDMGDVNPDLFFYVAHELRHCWQMSYDESYYLEGYKGINECSSVEEYNLQRAEIDAHAFACIVMKDFFGLKPVMRSLSDPVKEKIEERIKEIVTK